MDETVADGSSDSRTGVLIALAIFAIPALVCLVKALRAKTPSRRFAFLGALCGFLLLVQVEFFLGIKAPSIGAMLIGSLRALLAVAGLVYGIRALIQRTRDRGIGFFIPILAFVACICHGLFAYSLFLAPQASESVAKGQPWVYKSEEDQVEFTLPSEYWVKARVPGAPTGFRCLTLPVQVGLQLDKESHSDFDKRAKIFQANELPNLRAGMSESGKTPAGHDYFMAGGYDKQPTKELLIHIVHLYRRDRHQTVSLLSEATLTTTSDEKRAEQETAIREALRSIAQTLR